MSTKLPISNRNFSSELNFVQSSDGLGGVPLPANLFSISCEFQNLSHNYMLYPRNGWIPFKRTILGPPLQSPLLQTIETQKHKILKFLYVYFPDFYSILFVDFLHKFLVHLEKHAHKNLAADYICY